MGTLSSDGIATSKHQGDQQHQNIKGTRGTRYIGKASIRLQVMENATNNSLSVKGAVFLLY